MEEQLLTGEAKQPERRFRLNAKHLFLTYPQTGDLDIEELKGFLCTELDIAAGAICKEEHEDEGVHYHAYLRLNRKCDIRSPRKLDFRGHHGKYEATRNPKKAYEYVNKSPIDYLQWGDIELKAALVNEIKEATSRLDVMNIVIKHEVIHQHAFWLKWWDEVNLTKVSTAPIRDLDTFIYPNEIDEWIINHDNKCLVLDGISGTGKTSLARSIARIIGTEFWCTNLQSLRGYNGEDTIIFDDVGLSSFQRENIISICDVEQLQTIRVLYGTMAIPAGTRRIFSTNAIRFLFGEHNGDPAIQRRIRVIEINRSLFDRGHDLVRREELPFFPPQARRNMMG